MTVHDAVTLLAVLLAAACTATGFLIKNALSNNTSNRALLQSLVTEMRVMNEGASKGAREMIARVETRQNAIDDRQDEFETETRNRIGNLALDVVRVTDRVNGHIQTPNTHAHPPQLAG